MNSRTLLNATLQSMYCRGTKVKLGDCEPGDIVLVSSKKEGYEPYYYVLYVEDIYKATSDFEAFATVLNVNIGTANSLTSSLNPELLVVVLDCKSASN